MLGVVSAYFAEVSAQNSAEHQLSTIGAHQGELATFVQDGIGCEAQRSVRHARSPNVRSVKASAFCKFFL